MSLLKKKSAIATLNLPEVAEKMPLHILRGLEKEARQFDPSAEFRFVGGCVRDTLMGRKPKDWDIVTNTSPETLERMGLEPVGKAFPVYLLRSDELGNIEIAVARSEEKTGVGHKGFTTTPNGDFEADIVRRDLNINALAVASDGGIVGPSQALQQLSDKMLDKVSDKFGEDPLRVFRVARFASQFGDQWRVSESLLSTMSEMQHELSSLPPDRVREEMRKALVGKSPVSFFHILRETGCDEPWFTEIGEQWDAVEPVLIYGQNRWDADKFVIAIASVLTTPDSLLNRLGYSNQLAKAARFIKENRHVFSSPKSVSKEQLTTLLSSSTRGILSLEEQFQIATLKSRGVELDYLQRCAEAMKQVDMEGVTSRSEATARWVDAVSKIAGAPKPWETPQFKAWFGKSVVVNPDGTPKRVMHGTTHQFDRFNPNIGNTNGFYGSAIYFTDCDQDVQNYAGIGPDLETRLEEEAEMLGDDDEFMDKLLADPKIKAKIVDEDGNVGGGWRSPQREALREILLAEARKRLVGPHEGTVYLTFLKMENPVIVTPKGGSYLMTAGDFDPETDEYIPDPSEQILRDTVDIVANRFGFNTSNLFESIIQDGELRAWDFEKAVRRDYYDDENNNPGEFLRELYEELGYDGIIMDASAAFPSMKMRAGTRHYILWNPKQVKSAIGNVGNYDPQQESIVAAVEDEDTTKLEDPELQSQDEHRISPRLPSGKSIMEDPHGDEPLQVDYQSWARNEKKKYLKDLGAMTKYYPNFKGMLGRAHHKAERIIQHMVDNLVFLYDQWAEDLELQNEVKQWYDGGNRIINRWAKLFDIPAWQVAGVVAVLSPQQHWFQNLTQAERVLLVLTKNKDLGWTKEMTEIVTSKGWGKVRSEEEEEDGEVTESEDATIEESKLRAAIRSLMGMLKTKQITSLNDLLASEIPGKEYLSAIWIRAYAQAHTPNVMREITPSGRMGSWFLNNKGDYAPVKWTNFGNIAKAIQVLNSQSKKDLSRIIGPNHKVRSFYNNLIAPKSKAGDVTIDTHAVAAALLRPLGGSSVEVSHNFGTTPGKKYEVPGVSSSKITGCKGLYAIYAEAYRRAAAKLSERHGSDLLPRELQSITWEALRSLFTPELKRNKQLIQKANDIWLAYTKNPDDGGIDADEARKQIVEAVKQFDSERFEEDGRLKAPSWRGSHHQLYDGPGHSTYEGELPSTGGPRPKRTDTRTSSLLTRRVVRRIGSDLLKRAGIYDGYCPICGSSNCRGECAPGRKNAAPEATPQMRAKTYWHGTVNEDIADSILSQGLVPSSDLELDLYEGHTEVLPLPGRVYVGSLPVAIQYALGAAGHPVPHDDDYRFLFKIDGNSLLKDCTPDEDFVGALGARAMGLELGSQNFNQDAEELFAEVFGIPLASLKNIQQKMLKVMPSLPDFIEKKLIAGEHLVWPDLAVIGRALLPRLSDQEKLHIMQRFNSAIAHEGVIRPVAAWRVSMDILDEIDSEQELDKWGERIL